MLSTYETGHATTRYDRRYRRRNNESIVPNQERWSRETGNVTEIQMVKNV